MMKDNSWNLSEFSASLRRQAEAREAERKAAEEALGEPDLFVPFEDGPEGHGIGYWVMENKMDILAFRRYSNGYEIYPCQRYSVEFLRTLLKLAEEKQ